MNLKRMMPFKVLLMVHKRKKIFYFEFAVLFRSVIYLANTFERLLFLPFHSWIQILHISINLQFYTQRYMHVNILFILISFCTFKYSLYLAM